jgi:hypothetical protein
MDYFQLNSLELLLIFTGLVTEGCCFLLYKKTKLRLKKLSGTGRVVDIEVAYNWQAFFRLAMVAVPVLLYLLKSSILPA